MLNRGRLIVMAAITGFLVFGAKGQAATLIGDGFGRSGSPGIEAQIVPEDVARGASDYAALDTNPLGTLPVASTPEPSTDAMLLGGVALLAAAGFRRRNRR